MAMSATIAKRRAKARAVLAGKQSFEPSLDPENYKSSLGNALNHYSMECSSKDMKKFALDYYKKANKEIYEALKDLEDYRFMTFGTLCRLKHREEPVQQSDWFDKKLAELLQIATTRNEEVIEEDKPKAKVISIQDRIRAKAGELAGEIEGAIDDFCANGYKPTDFSIKGYLTTNEVNAQIAKVIGDFYVPVLEELKEAQAGTDEQLNEGYAHIKKLEMKRFISFIEEIVAGCNQQVQSAKATRAPRQKKAVPPTKIVARVKYQREDEDLKLKSIKPVDLLNSTEIFVYNTKYRTITQYISETGLLGIKGTSIVGFDTTKSRTYKLRKPEEFFKGLSLGKRALNNAMKSIKTKSRVPNGRLNDQCILVGAF